VSLRSPTPEEQVDPMPRCVIVELKSGKSCAFRFPAPQPASAWFDIYSARLRDGGCLIFRTPTPRGPFITVLTSDRIASIRLARPEEIDSADTISFNAE
jgi:hypothetical protein